MPISVLCPSCSAPVTAPDSAAGKRAKCPKCQELMLLPDAEVGEDFDVVDEPAPKRKPRVVEDDDEDERPRKKSSRRVVATEEDDEDDEDDERPRKKSRRSEDDDDRPRKKGKASKKAGPPMGLIVGGGLALLLLVAGGLYFGLKGGGSSAATGGGGAAPVAGPKGPNWVPFDAPDGSFALAFPDGAPTLDSIESLAKLMSGKKRNAEEMAQSLEAMRSQGVKVDGWTKVHGDRTYKFVRMAVPAALARGRSLDSLVNRPANQSTDPNGDRILSETEFSTGLIKGKQVLEHSISRNKWVYARLGVSESTDVIMLVVESQSAMKPDDADAKTFFEKFQWKK